MKAKEWLKANGHIAEIGRGRISHENHLRLQRAHDNGQRFSDWPKGVLMATPVETVATAGQVDAVVTYHRTDGYDASGNIAEIAPYLYNHDTHKAVEADGTVRSLREVCYYDGVSLVQCTCGHPKVVASNGRGYVAVTIVAGASKPRKGNVWDK
jgi:hypothetical protein